MEEMRQASMALMELVPTEPTEVQKVDLGRDERGRGLGNRMRNTQQRPQVSRRAA